MNDPCSLVQDLLPLYRERLLHPNSAAYVESHLASCASCRAALSELDTPTAPPMPPQDTAPLMALRHSLRVRKLQAALLAASLACAALLTAFAWLTNPRYLPYHPDLISVSSLSDETSAILFAPEITGYSCTWSAINGQDVCSLRAWNTLWDQLFPRQGPQSFLIRSDTLVLYASGNGEPDVTLLGPDTTTGSISLPRLALGYYLLLAVAGLAVLLLMRLLLRTRPQAACWLERLAAFPAAYLLAHLAVKGAETATDSLQRDLFFLLGIAFFLVIAFQLLLLRLHRRPL